MHSGTKFSPIVILTLATVFWDLFLTCKYDFGLSGWEVRIFHVPKLFGNGPGLFEISWWRDLNRLVPDDECASWSRKSDAQAMFKL